MKKYLKKTATILCCLCFLSGCSKKIYLLTTEYVASDIPEAAAEIVKSPTYERERKGLKVIAIQAPDYCTSDTSAQKSGKSSYSVRDIAIMCGVAMAEIERGLVKHGYQVISWVELAKAEKHYQRSPRDAAEKLNANAIFLINSTERGSVNHGENARWERKFYKSNGDGDQGQSALVNDKQKKLFLRSLKKTENKISQQKRLSVTVNASVFLVSTGKSVWFYNWTHSEEKKANVKSDIVVTCNVKRCRRIPKDKQGNRSRNLSSGDTSAVSTQGRPANVKKAIQMRLMKEAIKDLVEKFSGN